MHNIYQLNRRKALLGMLCSAAGTAIAQSDFPQRPIKLVVPFAPGGVTDILGRIVAERLAPLVGQPVVVENRPGASGHLGAQQVAQSPGDGHTLLVGTIGIHAAYASYKKLNYNPATDLQPVMVLADAPNVVLVPAASPYKTFAEFFADAKARPGRIDYAHAGAGSSVHMVTVLFELASGVKLNPVPYKGSGPGLIDLIGGQVQVMFDNISSALPHLQSGKLRALAVTGAARDPKLPNVPTVAESGVPGYAAGSWFTIAAPRSTPPALVERLNREIKRALATPDAIARFDAVATPIVASTPAEAARFFVSETKKWNKVIQAANLQLD
jgi:tripartite-type tricarboxylate transporter receptor subunit TctC